MEQARQGESNSRIAHGRGQIAALVGGDIIAFIVFAAIGRRSHGEAAGFGALLEVIWTAAPFIAGWFVVAPWLGAYRFATSGSLLSVVLRFTRRSALVWLAAWPVGLVLRALLLNRSIPLSFALVTLITNTILLCGWRAVFAWVARSRQG